MPTEVTLKSSLSLSLSLTHTHTQPQVSTILHVRGLPRLDREKLAKRLASWLRRVGHREATHAVTQLVISSILSSSIDMDQCNLKGIKQSRWVSE